MEDISFYVSIATGFLLTISEVLPYITSIQSNGILELIINNLLKRSNRTGTDEENARLLNERPNERPIEQNVVLPDNKNIVVNSSNVTFTFNSARVKLEFVGSEIVKEKRKKSEEE
jgi:hypothetical protein